MTNDNQDEEVTVKTIGRRDDETMMRVVMGAALLAALAALAGTAPGSVAADHAAPASVATAVR